MPSDRRRHTKQISTSASSSTPSQPSSIAPASTSNKPYTRSAARASRSAAQPPPSSTPAPKRKRGPKRKPASQDELQTLVYTLPPPPPPKPKLFVKPLIPGALNAFYPHFYPKHYVNVERTPEQEEVDGIIEEWWYTAYRLGWRATEEDWSPVMLKFDRSGLSLHGFDPRLMAPDEIKEGEFRAGKWGRLDTKRFRLGGDTTTTTAVAIPPNTMKSGETLGGGNWDTMRPLDVRDFLPYITIQNIETLDALLTLSTMDHESDAGKDSDMLATEPSTTPSSSLPSLILPTTRGVSLSKWFFAQMTQGKEPDPDGTYWVTPSESSIIVSYSDYYRGGEWAAPECAVEDEGYLRKPVGHDGEELVNENWEWTYENGLDSGTVVFEDLEPEVLQEQMSSPDSELEDDEEYEDDAKIDEDDTGYNSAVSMRDGRHESNASQHSTSCIVF